MNVPLDTDVKRARQYYAINADRIRGMTVELPVKLPAKIRRANYIVLIDLYIIHSYLYYTLEHPLIPDHAYDQICRYLYLHFDNIKPMKLWWTEPGFFNRESLGAATGYHISATNKYPQGYPTFHKDLAHEMLKLKPTVYKDTKKEGPFSFFVADDDSVCYTCTNKEAPAMKKVASLVVDIKHIRCGNCKMQVKDEQAKSCPHCEAVFDRVVSNHAGLANKLRKSRGEAEEGQVDNDKYPELVGS